MPDDLKKVCLQLSGKWYRDERRLTEALSVTASLLTSPLRSRVLRPLLLQDFELSFPTRCSSWMALRILGVLPR